MTDLAKRTTDLTVDGITITVDVDAKVIHFGPHQVPLRFVTDEDLDALLWFEVDAGFSEGTRDHSLVYSCRIYHTRVVVEDRWDTWDGDRPAASSGDVREFTDAVTFWRWIRDRLLPAVDRSRASA